MKYFLNFILSLFMLVNICSCDFNKNYQNNKKNNLKNVSEKFNMKEAEENKNCNNTFILTEKELKYYNILCKTLSSKSLKDLDPISIAKIYLFCGINQNWKAEYALINKDNLTYSLEEWIKYNEEEFKKVDINYIKERADSLASFIDKGNFIEEGNRPYILFYTSAKDKIKFQFVKTSENILEVSLPPLIYI